MKNASLTIPTLKMLTVGLSASCSLAYAGGTEGYLRASTAAGYSDVGPTAIYADQGGVQDSIASREAVRRMQRQNAALQLLQEGRTAYQEGRYREALEKYDAAWERVPHAPATRKMQEFIRQSIGDASVAVAIEDAKQGRYDEAEQLLLRALEIDPNNARARKELTFLRDPVRNNPALNPEHVRDVEEVNRLLDHGWGAYNLGRYDEALSDFAKVLRIDPYNVAALRGQESVNNRKMRAFQAAHNSKRAEMLAEVDGMWSQLQPSAVEYSSTQVGDSGAGVADSRSEGEIRISDALNTIRVSQATFDNTPITDVVAFILGEIRKSGVEHINVNYVAPTQTAAPVQQPVASVSDEDEEDSIDEDEEDRAPATPAVAAQPYKEPTVTVNLQDVTLRELLNQVCDLSGCVPVVRNTGVFIYTKGDPNAVELVRRVWYNVPESYLSDSEGGDEDGGGDEDDAWTGGGSSTRKGKIDAQRLLTRSLNISWSPKGSYAAYSKSAQRLTVCNTPEAIEEIDGLITDARANETPMIKISTKFVEVTQQNDEELSFDWVVNPFSVSNNGTSYLGGVNGSGSMPPRTYDDFVTSGGSAYASHHKNDGTWPINNPRTYGSGSDPLTNGLMTGGLRTGSGAIAASTMDSLLTVGSPSGAANASPAPGILSLSGIYNEGSFQMIMRGLSQKKGADVMTAPSLVLTPGADVPDGPVDELVGGNAIEAPGARIEVVRRFVYPNEYEAPDIPDNNGGGGGNWNNGGGTMSVPVAAPANPSSWAAEEVGLVMVVNVADAPVNNIIKFNTFMVRVVEFEGFINYGSPIISGVANQNTIETIVLTENRIDQPVFSRKFVNTTLSIYDGHTVAIGGIVEDKVQKVEDKVPVFGDLPIIGRFFRSNAESHFRKNLTIFVTADIIDAMGNPVRSRGAEASGVGATVDPGIFPEDGLVH